MFRLPNASSADFDIYDPGDNSITPGIDSFDRERREIGHSLILPLTGTYAIVLLPAGLQTGSLDVRLITDNEIRVRIDGPSVRVPIDVPGQNAIVRFQGREGQRAAVFASDFALGVDGRGSAAIDVYDPGDDLITHGIDAFDAGNGELGGHSLILPRTGTYAIIVLPGRGETGSFDLRVTGDVEKRIRVDGRPVTVRIDTPGQNAIVRFEGTSGDTVELLASNFALGANAGGSAAVEVYDPGDDEITPGSPILDGGTRTLAPLELPSSGTYAILVLPDRGQTGSVALRLRSR